MREQIPFIPENQTDISRLFRNIGERFVRLGFAGPRKGVNDEQFLSLERMLTLVPGILEGHHGDGVGGDVDFHQLCRQLEIPIHIHPPKKSSNRAFCKGAIATAKKRDGSRRNRDIVESTDLLLAIPPKDKEVVSSGIWASVRHARKLGRCVLIVRTNGEIVAELG